MPGIRSTQARRKQGCRRKIGRHETGNSCQVRSRRCHEDADLRAFLYAALATFHTNNTIKRLNLGIRRRTRVLGTFSDKLECTRTDDRQPQAHSQQRMGARRAAARRAIIPKTSGRLLGATQRFVLRPSSYHLPHYQKPLPSPLPHMPVC